MNKYSKLPSWKKIPPGAVMRDGGNSQNHDTGNWVIQTCKWNSETCINCGKCFFACPDNAILTNSDGKIIGVDAAKCKACGLCTQVCPTNPKSLKIVDKKKEEI